MPRAPKSSKPFVPVAEPRYNEGKIAPISPSADSKRNGKLIYDAIKNRDPGQRLRAGYTWKGEPYIAFVSKKSWLVGKNEAYNIQQQRRELMNIFATVCDNSLTTPNNLSNTEKVEVMNFSTLMKHGAPRDLKVRDVIGVMKTLSDHYEQRESSKNNNVRRTIAAARTPKDDRKNRETRIAAFLQRDSGTNELLCKSLSRSKDDADAVKASVASMAKLFTALQQGKDGSLDGIIVRSINDKSLLDFAVRWTELRKANKDHSKKRFDKFAPHSWSKLMDQVTAQLLEAAQSRDQHSKKGVEGANDRSVIYVRSTASSGDGVLHNPNHVRQSAAPGLLDPDDESDETVGSPSPQQGLLSPQGRVVVPEDSTPDQTPDLNSDSKPDEDEGQTGMLKPYSSTRSSMRRPEASPMMHALSKTQPRAVSPVNKQREETINTGSATAIGDRDQTPGIRQTMSGGRQPYLSPSPEANQDSEIQGTPSGKRLSRRSFSPKSIVKLIAPPGRRSSLTLRSPSVEHKTRQKLSLGEEASPPVEWLWERPDYGSPSGKSLSGIEQAKRPIRSVETIERTTLTVSPFTNGIGNSASVGQAAPGKKPEPEPFRLEEFKVGEISNTVLMEGLPVEIRLGDSLEQTTLIPSPSENGSNKKL